MRMAISLIGIPRIDSFGDFRESELDRAKDQSLIVEESRTFALVLNGGHSLGMVIQKASSPKGMPDSHETDRV